MKIPRIYGKYQDCFFSLRPSHTTIATVKTMVFFNSSIVNLMNTRAAALRFLPLETAQKRRKQFFKHVNVISVRGTQ